MAYETLDQAEAEGTGAEATVVTASYPFAGFVSSAGVFDPGGRVAAVTTSVALRLWTYDALAPRRPSPGLINGKVVRPVALPGAATPTYAPVAGALVSGVDVSGQPLWAVGTGQSVAVTQADGTFALWDLRFTGGTVTISATHGGLTRTAVVYEAPPDAPRSPAMTAYPHLATVTVTFPPEAPAPPPPAIDVRVFREVGGVRVDTQGLVTVGEPLTIGLTVPASATNPATWLAPTVSTGRRRPSSRTRSRGRRRGSSKSSVRPSCRRRRARTRSSRARSLPALFLTLLTCTRCPPIA